jgi:hypothetical protein
VVEGFRIPWAIHFIIFLLISYFLFIDFIKFIIYIDKFNYYLSLNIKDFLGAIFILFFDLYIFINLLKILLIIKLFLYIQNSFTFFTLLKY